MIKHLRFWSREWLYRRRLDGARSLLQSPAAERALGQLGIPGVGTCLSRQVYPLYGLKEYLAGGQTHCFDTLLPIFESTPFYDDSFLAQAKQMLDELLEIPARLRGDDGVSPVLDNDYFSVFDSLIYSYLLQSKRPSRIVEIGSGFSTRLARHIIDKARMNTHLVSIDPSPRTTIQQICDEVIETSFQAGNIDLCSMLRSGDLLFLDGSHYAYPGSDVVSVLLQVLPSLPEGVLVHVHDIYLPWEYPAAVAQQIWNEQYILAAWLLGGAQGLEIVFPGYYCSGQPGLAFISERIGMHCRQSGFSAVEHHTRSSSLWLRTRA